MAALSDVPGVLGVQQYGESLHVLVDSAGKRSRAVKRALRRAKVGYRGLRSAPIRMEEAFLSLMEEVR
jgi:hypothetical protein